MGGDVEVSLSFVLETRVGVDPSGFFLDTTYANPELLVTLSVSASNLIDVDGDFGLLKLRVTDNGSSLVGTFSVDLVDSDGKLGHNRRLECP